MTEAIERVKNIDVKIVGNFMTNGMITDLGDIVNLENISFEKGDARQTASGEK
jgi:hypothetical protein